MSYSVVEEFNQTLWELRNPNMPHKAIILPSDEVIYNIDLDNRVVETPSFLGVTREQGAETVYFLVDRFFGEIDLATTACMVQFVNQEGESGFYPVPFYDITTYSPSAIEEGFRVISFNDQSEYIPNKFYTKRADGKYILSTGDYQENRTYYELISVTNNGFEPVFVNSGTYKPNTYYIKVADGQYVVATGAYSDQVEQYYRLSSPNDNRRYVVDNNVNETNYRPGVFYYIDPNTNDYICDNNPYNPIVIKYAYNEQGELQEVEQRKTFYRAISKSFVKTNVDGNNYKSKYYYVLNKDGEMELDTEGYILNREYYSIVDKPKILFPWSIGDLASAAAGTIQFAINFYKMSPDGLETVYSLFTKPAVSKILDTLHIEVTDEQFAARADELKIFDTSLPSDEEALRYWESIQYNPTTLQDLYYRIAFKELNWIEA